MPLECGHLLHEFIVFARRAEAHHALDARAVVPRAVEEDDLARRWKMLDVALKVPLPALAFRRLFQCHHARAAWIQMLHEAFDGAALARRIAPFEKDHDALAGV